MFEKKLEKIVQEEYDLSDSDTEKVVKKVIKFIEEGCLEWNHIRCEWEYI